MLQFGRNKLAYEKYKWMTTTIALNNPLRSLPDGVYDTYESGVITRRVGSVVLNGSETWTKNNGWETNGISCFYHTVNERESRSYAICDKFVTKSFVDSMKDGKITFECLYASFFEGVCPARSAVAVKTLPKEARVEIECIAVR